jgi:hypothetical protein
MPIDDPTGANPTPPYYPRPVTSALDTFDQKTQVDYAVDPMQSGARPLWNIPAIAVANESVNTINSSAATQFVSVSVPTSAGMTANPFTRSTDFHVVPNMAQTIYTTSSVQISFSLNVSTETVPDEAVFALFRDGQQLSQTYTVTTSTAYAPVPLTNTYVDTNPARNTTHVYDLRWKRVTSAAIANGKTRTFQASNLRAQ